MAAVRIVIPTALRQYAANHDAVDVEAESVEQALGDLVDRFDQLRRHLYADSGQLRNFVNVYVNEEDIRYLEKDATPLKEGDTISIVPSIAGGSFSLMDRLGAKRKDVLMPAEIKRYSRHLNLPEVGMAGQLKLKQSSALIIGAGDQGGRLFELQLPRHADFGQVQVPGIAFDFRRHEDVLPFRSEPIHERKRTARDARDDRDRVAFLQGGRILLEVT